MTRIIRFDLTGVPHDVPSHVSAEPGRAWTQLELVACVGFIGGHFNLLKVDIGQLSLPPDNPARRAALESALRHLGFMRMAEDDLAAELKRLQASQA